MCLTKFPTNLVEEQLLSICIFFLYHIPNLITNYKIQIYIFNEKGDACYRHLLSSSKEIYIIGLISGILIVFQQWININGTLWNRH